MRHLVDDIQRVLDAHRDSGDWHDLASRLKIPYKTAWQWTDKAEDKVLGGCHIAAGGGSVRESDRRDAHLSSRAAREQLRLHHV